MSDVVSDVRIAFAGDSFVAGLGDECALGWVGRIASRARQAGHDITSYNLGVRRETTAEVAARLAREAAPRLRDGDAFGLVLSTGVNDTALLGGRSRCTQDETVTALDAMLHTAADAGWSVLVVGPPLVADDDHNTRILQRSAVIAAACSRRGIPFVDTAGALAGDVHWAAEVTAGDGSHPGARGYERLAGVIWPPFAHWLRTVVR